MKRLTDRNSSYENEFCKDCPDYGEPNGCNRKDGECEAYFKFTAFADRLAELEDKLESGQLIEFPRITETVKGLEWAVEYLSITNHGSGIAKIFCGTREQAEAQLKELKEGKHDAYFGLHNQS